MSDIDLNDDLPWDTPATKRELPADASFARIRDLDGVPPVAKPYRETCKKCVRGRFISYSGRDCGPCYTCKGAGFKEFKTAAPVRAANRERAVVSKAKTEQDNWDALVSEYPAEAAWIVKTAATPITERNQRFIEIVQDYASKVRKYGSLTAGQLDVVRRGLARDAERAAQKAQTTVQQQERVAGIDVANIVDCFRRAQEAGLKRFTLRFADAHFEGDRRDPALIWVSAAGYGSDKYGRIQGGVFKPGRDASAEVLARIAAISQDPMAAALAYAQVTSSCSVCGRHLENQDSVDAGIGPVCAGRINRPGLKFVEVKNF